MSMYSGTSFGNNGYQPINPGALNAQGRANKQLGQVDRELDLRSRKLDIEDKYGPLKYNYLGNKQSPYGAAYLKSISNKSAVPTSAYNPSNPNTMAMNSNPTGGNTNPMFNNMASNEQPNQLGNPTDAQNFWGTDQDTLFGRSMIA